jgi:hypothetical protein
LSGYVSTLAGGYPTASYRDGSGTNVYFSNPGGITVSSLGDVYVFDENSYILRHIDTAGNEVGGFVLTNLDQLWNLHR